VTKCSYLPGGRAACGALLAALALPAPAAALQIDNGDLVGIFSKGGVEVIVNLGPAQAGEAVSLPSTAFDDPAFGGSSAGAKFVGLAVEDPARTVNVPGLGSFPQENVIYTTMVEDPMPSDLAIEQAMNILESPSPGSTVWFQQLRALPGTLSDVLDSSQQNSYEQYIGKGTDAIANNFPFSTAVTVGQDERITVPVYSAVRGYEPFGGDPTEYVEVARLALDGTDATFEPAPEAPAVLRTLCGALVLAAFELGRRRSRSA